MNGFKHMQGVEIVNSKKTTVGIVFRRFIKVSGIKFLTEDANPFQVGIHERKKGVNLVPHIHNLSSPLRINEIQEILFIQKGKIRVTFYTAGKKLLARKILTAGDAVLIMREAHQVDFLEDSRIFEVKQGPYPGAKKAKTYL